MFLVFEDLNSKKLTITKNFHAVSLISSNKQEKSSFTYSTLCLLLKIGLKCKKKRQGKNVTYPAFPLESSSVVKHKNHSASRLNLNGFIFIQKQQFHVISKLFFKIKRKSFRKCRYYEQKSH